MDSVFSHFFEGESPSIPLDANFNQFSSTHEAWQILAKQGLFDSFFNITINDFPSWKKIIHQVSHITFHCPQPNLVLAALFQLSGIMIPLNLFANDILKQRYMQQLQNGKLIAAHCLTDPCAGTDVLNMQSTARRHHDYWIINGVKTYICNALSADLGLVYALNNDKHKQLLCFLVDMQSTNIRRSEPLEKIGLDTVQMASIYFDDVAVKETNIVGNEAAGQTIMQASTTFERLIIPIGFIGIMIKLYQFSYDVSKRQTKAEPYLADLYLKIYSSITLLNATLSTVDLTCWHRDYIKQGCVVKTYVSESYIACVKIVRSLLKKLGQDVNQLEKAHADSLSSWIYSGTNDVLKSMLARLL